jgi:hypothetical protein
MASFRAARRIAFLGGLSGRLGGIFCDVFESVRL